MADEVGFDFDGFFDDAKDSDWVGWVEESVMELMAELGSHVRLRMQENAVDLGRLSQRWLPDVELKGILTELEVEIENMGKPLAEWQVDAAVQVDRPRFGRSGLLFDAMSRYREFFPFLVVG